MKRYVSESSGPRDPQIFLPRFLVFCAACTLLLTGFQPFEPTPVPTGGPIIPPPTVTLHIPLEVIVKCDHGNLVVTIGLGDGLFTISGTGPDLPAQAVDVGSTTLTGPGTWHITVSETAGDQQSKSFDITCDEPSIHVPAPTALPTPTLPPLTPFPTLLPPRAPALLPPEPSMPFGLWGGTFTVDMTGAASYQIPIIVPPGRVDLKPELSLAYQSNQGYSSLGVGWRLAGLSRIHRCFKTYAADEIISPVHYEGNDNLCLDGERLVLISGSHEQEGAEYRTERDKFSRIVFARGPEFTGFRVYTLEGRILLYGFSSDANVLGRNTRNTAWLIRTVSDRYGNSITYEYQSVTTLEHPPLNQEDTEVVPIRIQYTSNNGTGGGAVLAAEREITFLYDEHPLPFLGYSSGVTVAVTRRLRQILTSVEGRPIRRYELTYDLSEATGRSLLSSVSQCDEDNVCLPPIRFDWELGSPDFGSLINISPRHFDEREVSCTSLVDCIFETIRNVGLTFSYRIPIGSWVELTDVNGDGRDDLLFTDGYNSEELFIKQAISVFDSDSPHEYPFSQPHSTNPRFAHDVFGRDIDFDRDRREDLIVGSFNSLWQVFRSVSSDYISHSLGIPASLDDNFRDINGDGYTDWIHCEDGQYYYAFGDGVSFNALSAAGNARANCASIRERFLDVNGDGALELLTPDGIFVLVTEFTGETPNSYVLSNVPAFTLTNSKSNLIADVNGDGLKDILVPGEDGDNRLWLADGQGYIGGLAGLPFTNANLQSAIIGDWNSDGKDDFLAPSYTEARMILYLTAGSSGFLHVIPTHLSSDLGAIGGDVDGNGTLDILGWTGHGYILYLHSTRRPDMLVGIHEITPTTYDITYSSLSVNDVYVSSSCSTESQYPIVCVPGGNAYVVSSYRADAGPNNPPLERVYKYTNAHLDLLGRGWLGFEAISVRDLVSQAQHTIEYDFTYDPVFRRYPYIGLPRTITEITPFDPAQPWNFQERRNEIAYAVRPVTADGEVYFPFTEQITSTELYVLGDGETTQIRHSVRTFSDMDRFGNAWTIQTDFGDGYIETRERQFLNDESPRWIISRLASETITSITPRNARTNTSVFEWQSSTGALVRVTTYERPDGLEIPVLSTINGYDQYGNRESITLFDHRTGDERTTSFLYDDSEHMFPQRVSNALGQEDVFVYDNGHGTIRRLRDPNGHVTRFGYDGFGRLMRIIDPSGAETRLFILPPGSTEDLAYTMSITTPGMPPYLIDIDRLGRPVQFSSIGHDGRSLSEEISYDQFGRIESQTLPSHATSGTPRLSYQYTYDGLGRLLEVIEPNGTTLRREYTLGRGLELGRVNSGNQAVIYDGEGNATRHYIDGLGNIELVTDALGVETLYRYGAFGLLEEIEDGEGNLISVVYDDYGFQTELGHPDMGIRSYEYNGFGEVIAETDSRGLTVEFGYDELGRRIWERLPLKTATWIYDTSANGIGHLASSTSMEGHIESYTYDTAGRVAAIQTNIDGLLFQTDLEYDADGRLQTLLYPDSNMGDSRFGIRMSYQNGFLSQIRDSRSGTPYWTLLATDTEGRTLHERFGNGVETNRTYDLVGRVKSIQTLTSDQVPIQDLKYVWDLARNLQARQDVLQNVTEGFCYDALNRLIDTVFLTGLVTPECTGEPDFTYDALGNMLTQGMVTYNWNAHTNSGRYLPHALSGLNTESGIFMYDDNGNMMDDGRSSFGWTYFNKVSSIEPRTGPSILYEYDTNESLVKRTSSSTTTYFVHDLYERTVNSSEMQENFQIFAKGRLITRIRRFDGVEIASYYHADHLGSVDVITDVHGHLATKRNYSAFGLRRSPDWVQPSLFEVEQLSTGYGGHRQEYGTNLVDMGGRIYSPVIGRFLSPDPFIHDIYSPQLLNAYAYVHNNPLSFTDPTGYQPQDANNDGYADKTEVNFDDLWVRVSPTVPSEPATPPDNVPADSELRPMPPDPVFRFGSENTIGHTPTQNDPSELPEPKSVGVVHLPLDEPGLETPLFDPIDLISFGRVMTNLGVKLGGKAEQLISRWTLREVGELGAHNLVQYERLKASLLAQEILKAPRASSAIKSTDDLYHYAGSFLSYEQLAAGRAFVIRGGDGLPRSLLQTVGSVEGKRGVFEYIVDRFGRVTHQRFLEGIHITGIPNFKP